MPPLLLAQKCSCVFPCLPAPVRPDPPVAVNWTLLGVSPYGPHYDVIVSWDPPPSADVSMGWMRLAYEVQYRRRNSSEWTVVSAPASVTSSFTLFTL